MGVPEFPWFSADGPELAFGAGRERYLDISKEEAAAICAALPEETNMADMLFERGHLGEEQFGMNGREWGLPPGVDPEAIKKTTGALLRSFGVSHEVKIATIAVALHRWFPRSHPNHQPEGSDNG